MDTSKSKTNQFSIYNKITKAYDTKFAKRLNKLREETKEFIRLNKNQDTNSSKLVEKESKNVSSSASSMSSLSC